MTHWQVRGLFDFLDMPLETAHEAGFLIEVPDRLRHESLRRLMLHPASTFHRPVRLVQQDRELGLDDAIDSSAEHNQIRIERDESTSIGNPRALSLKDCHNSAFEGCRCAVIRIVDRLFGFERQAIRTKTGRTLHSLAQMAGDMQAILDTDACLRVLFRLAQIIHSHPFENISKIIKGVPFCSGWEMWDRMDAGFGGICSEKTGAFLFMLDILGVEAFYVAGARTTIPADFEAQLKCYITSGGDATQPVWIEHLLAGFRLDGHEYLTDVTNGNLPFLFLNERDMQRFLRGGYRGRMVYSTEQMRLRRISRWAGDALLTLSEFHVPDLHFQYIFEQSLGLHISSSMFVGAFFDWGGERSARYQQHYATLADEQRLPSTRFMHEANLHALPDAGLRHTLQRVLTALRERYVKRHHYTGDFTFVLQPLHPYNDPRAFISSNLRPLLTERYRHDDSEDNMRY